MVGKQAKKYIEKLDKPTRERFAKQFSEIEKDPINNSGAIVNSDPPLRSSRVGTWRIIFSINETDQILLITTVLPRGQVYDPY